MGRRDSKSDKKLVLNRETLRTLPLRTLTDDQLRAAGGGWYTTRPTTDAPSHCGC